MSELKTILSGRISGGDARALAGGSFKEELFQLLFDEDKRTSDNAAWVLTHLPKTADAWLAERQNTLIDEVMRTESTTKRRLIMNLLERTPFEAKQILSRTARRVQHGTPNDGARGAAGRVEAY